MSPYRNAWRASEALKGLRYVRIGDEIHVRFEATLARGTTLARHLHPSAYAASDPFFEGLPLSISFQFFVYKSDRLTVSQILKIG